jgi:hypothetical protein
MKIFVGSTAYEVDAVTSIEQLKLQIENAEFIPSHQICLMNGADVLEAGSLESNGIEEDDTLEMRMAVSAGMRKKWRKKRSKYYSTSYELRPFFMASLVSRLVFNSFLSVRRLRRKRRKMRQRAR